MAISTHLDRDFAQAVDAFQTKDYAKAAGLCRRLLLTHADHAAALHLLGVIEHGYGRSEEAEAMVRRSISLAPGFAEMEVSFAQILSARGKHAEAIAHFEAALVIKPDHAGARLALAHALNNLGAVLCEQAHFSESVKCFEQAVILCPNFSEALNNLGVVCFEQKKYDDALRHYENALSNNPRYASALNNLGNVRKARGEWAEAIACYREALSIQPDLVQALNNLGLALLYGCFDSIGAAECFELILLRQADFVPALTHLGIARCLQGSFADGLALYDKALKVEPHYRDALNNKGNALRALGQTAEAIACFEQVVALQPEDPEGRNNLGMAYLAVGRFDEGWSNYESRWQTAHLAGGARHFDAPAWQGGPGEGKTILIHAEQGFGDTLQFARFVPLLAAHGYEVIFEAQNELVRLLKTLDGNARIISRGQPLPHFDIHCPLLSLPHFLKLNSEAQFQVESPYLRADAKNVEVWKARVSLGTGVRKVGLVWSGNPRLFSLDLAAANQRRSVPVHVLEQLCGLLNVQFYNLQKNADQLPRRLGIVDLMGSCEDFADTAALIANLDLVISVDTAVAHLAASLGKPVWLLNRFDTCWRWQHEREDSPWYSSLRLFRQREAGNWEPVIANVRAALTRCH